MTKQQKYSICGGDCYGNKCRKCYSKKTKGKVSALKSLKNKK